MLDRIAGTTSQAAAFGASLHTLRQMEQQLADIASLGNEEERNEVQQMIQEVTKFYVCKCNQSMQHSHDSHMPVQAALGKMPINVHCIQTLCTSTNMNTLSQ